MVKPLKIQGKFFLSSDYKATTPYDTSEELAYALGLDRNSHSERDRRRFAAVVDNFAGRLQEWEGEIRTEVEAGFNETLYQHDFNLAHRYFAKSLMQIHRTRWKDHFRPLTEGELQRMGHTYAAQIPPARREALAREWLDDFRG